MAPLFTEFADHWQLSVPDLVVTRLLIDYQVTLQLLVPGGSLDISIGLPFTITTEVGVVQLNPADDPRLLAPTLAAARKRLESLKAFKDGRLDLVLEGGAIWRVERSPRFEAWQISGPGGLLTVALPGGSLAEWHQREEPEPRST